MTQKIAVVGMSGGVDSSVCASIAARAGYRVIGVMLQLKSPGAAREADEAAFAAVASCLNIESRILPAPEFDLDVIRHCALEYASGRTPNPCCECNVKVKFKRLLEFARSEYPGATVWTGHYANISNNMICRGSDRGKDQSYFLYRLNPESLQDIVMPLGKMTKDEVRRAASELALPVFDRPDSQDVCFGVPGECCGETLRKLAGLPEKIGYFLYNGKIVGSHRGVGKYTIGQRSKLGVALGVPAYISKIDPVSGDITLATDSAALECRKFYLKDVTLHTGSLPEKAEIQIRYRSRPTEVFLSRHNDMVAVESPEPLRAVTPGQAGVIYAGDTLLGGGIISLTAE